MLIQNKRLEKLTTIENKLDGIQQKMVEYENKLNQLEKENEQLRDKMVQKRSHTSTVQATEVHAKILFSYVYLLLHSQRQHKS